MHMILCISCTYVKIFIDYMGFILKKMQFTNQQSHEKNDIILHNLLDMSEIINSTALPVQGQMMF